MTDNIWDQLSDPFPAGVVKERQGPKQHADACTKQYGQCTQRHMMLSYVDARDVAERLDHVLTPARWSFRTEAVPNTNVVHGSLAISVEGDQWTVREDHGYPNSDSDEEPLKSATSDALKRCAVMFGIGRHLYDDNHPQRPAAAPRKPAAAPRMSEQDERNLMAPDEPPWPADMTAVAQEVFGAEIVGDESKCPDHGYAWKTNSRGYFCSGKTKGEWCKRRPSPAWAASQELQPA